MPPTSEENLMIEQNAKFEGLRELLEDDLEDQDLDDALFDSVAANLPELKQQYLSLKVAQAKYKGRFVASVVSEEDFNASESPYKYNDPYIDRVKKTFQRVNKAALAFLKRRNTGGAAEDKVQVADIAEVERILAKVKLEAAQVTSSLDETYKKLQSIVSISPSQASIYTDLKTDLMLVIDQKIPGLITQVTAMAGPNDQEHIKKMNAEFSTFENTEKTRLYQLVQIIADKTSHTQSSAPRSTSARAEAVHLKKVDPPKFSGEEEDFPEFHRKWLAIVVPAHLPEEAEVDRMKDALPKEAREMLTGVNRVSKAWDILKKRFGDEDLIATKLKNELKGLVISVKTDHEKIINLVIRIRSTVSRLESLNASEALKYDGEFVSAVYFQLPNRHRQEWLKFDKSKFGDKWSALLVFLEDAYESAVQEKLLLASYTPPPNTVKKGNAAALAARVEEADGRDTTDGAVGGQPAMSEDMKKRLEETRKKVGKCPVCGQEHTFVARFCPEPWPSDRFIQCKKFGDMSSKQKAEAIQKAGGCPRCTSWCHKKKDCKMNVVDCKEKVNGSRCHKDHSRLVCNSGVAYCLAVNSVAKKANADIDVFGTTLHYLQDIPVNKGDTGRVIWDNGSNRVLVDNKFAKERNLKSRQSTVTMKVVGAVQKVETMIYELDVEDMYGKQHTVWGYGMDKIIDEDDPVDLAPIRSLFPHVPDQAFQPLPKRRIDILIGLNFNELHPSGGLGVDAVGNLKALRSRFGCGWVIGGCHKKLEISPPKFTPQAATARLARVTVVPEVDVSPPDPPATAQKASIEELKVAKIVIDPVLTPEFWESEGMGVLPPRKCSKCKQCGERGDCSESHLLLTLKEEAELKLISDNIEIVNGETHVRYPFIKDPSCLPDNRYQVVKVASRLWSGLKKDGLLNVYHEEVQKYIDRGTFVKLTKEEMDTYEGPHQYITHHAVMKDSVTTPLRVVTNSSFNNHGNSLNSCLPKGPNSLNDMMAITIRFRCYEQAFMFDLSKAYNTMKTGVVEKHLRRFVWRFSEDEEWQDYAIDRVHFGDQPAACQLEVSKKKVAEIGRYIDPEAADKLVKDTYVDDGPSGGSKEAVQRMVGRKDADGNYDGTMSQILAKGNFKVKEYVIEGDQDQPDENLLGNTVFGYTYDPKKAMMGIKFSINLSRKRRNARTKPDLTLDDIGSLKTLQMTKRILLGLTNSFGDFLGIASPYTIRLKLNMKKLFEEDVPLSWDDDIPVNLRDDWIELIVETLVAGYLSFARSTRPDNATGGPTVVGFGDGAFAAYAAAVYLVWRISCQHEDGCQGHFSSTLLCAKCRVTPLRGFTIPRSELSGGVLVTRLVLAVVKALSRMEEKPVSSIILLDSECTISTLEENARKLKPFFHNRRGEMLDNMDHIRSICSLEDVHHVSGKMNPADLATRGNTKIEDIGPGSFWQAGPTFLCSPRAEWPVTREFIRVEIPDDEKRHPGQLATATFRAVVVKERKAGKNPDIVYPVKHIAIGEILEKNNSLESRKRVIALVNRGWDQPAGTISDLRMTEVLKPSPSALELTKAERMILAHGMFDTAQAYHQGSLVSLLPERQGPLIVTRGRLGEKSMERLLGVSALPILMPTSRAAELYMWRAHLGHSGLFHRSVAQTLAKSRVSVWIVKGKNLAKKICFECMECKRNRKQLAGQQMALLRDESLQCCPPFTFISLDFAGPVIIKGEVNTRSRKKSWILVYVCRSTKAVCLLATSGYSTEDFLCKHEEFVARKNRPRTIVSDRGSQLVRAGMVLADKEQPVNWKWEEVVRQNSTTNWEFVPVGSQHRNGLSESTVKVLKKSLHLALTPGTVLKYSELVTLLAKISHSINSRPLGIGSTSQDSQQEDFLSPLTPNQLLLGKTDDEAPPLDYDETDSHTARLAYVSAVYGAWWNAWYQQVLPTLVPYKKWRKEVRNLEVGDIVYMYYPNSIKDHYRLARVLETLPDEKGLVRTVRVGYRKRNKREKSLPYKAKPLTEELVAVQRLSVLLPASEQVPSTSDAPPVSSTNVVRSNITTSQQYSDKVSTCKVSIFSTPDKLYTNSHVINSIYSPSQVNSFEKNTQMETSMDNTP